MNQLSVWPLCSLSKVCICLYYVAVECFSSSPSSVSVLTPLVQTWKGKSDELLAFEEKYNVCLASGKTDITAISL